MKSDETTPTPRPWKVVKPFNQWDFWRVAVEDGREPEAAYADDYPGIDVVCTLEGGTQADAELIVRCVNSHDALVEALQELADYAGGYDEYADFGLAERITKARAALQQAGVTK